MKVFLFLISLIVLIACDNNNTKETGAPRAEEKAVVPDSVIDRHTGDSAAANVQVDSVIHIAFPKDSVSMTVRGHVGRKGEPVICLLPIAQGKKLTARVVADNKDAQIRISHIDFPDGSADGPFGNFMQYDLKQKGLHKLYIAPNMMAGDPVNTDFTLILSVE
jgi:hypothetical protein